MEMKKKEKREKGESERRNERKRIYLIVIYIFSLLKNVCLHIFHGDRNRFYDKIKIFFFIDSFTSIILEGTN